MDLVGFAGTMRAGKDESAVPLVARGWVVVKMAEPILVALRALDLEVTYKGCHLRLNGVLDDIGLDRAKVEIPYVRRVMQRLGTEAGRDIHGPDVWVNIARKRISDLLYSGQKVAVTDIRFPEEGAMIRGLGGRLVRIERPGTSGGDHASEAGLSDVDFTIHNTGTVDELHRAVLDFVNAH